MKSQIIPISKKPKYCVVRFMDNRFYFYYVDNKEQFSKHYDIGVWRIKNKK